MLFSLAEPLVTGQVNSVDIPVQILEKVSQARH